MPILSKRKIGNIIIAAAVAILFYIYSPILTAYHVPPKDIKVTPSGFFIEIPKIKAKARVLENVDPWNKEIYSKALREGVAHAKGSYLPGERGTSYLFAHSSGAPWDISRNNTIFLRLGELENGDTFFIYREGKRLEYIVTDKKEVWPNETGFLKDTKKDQLILQTCTPIGTDLKRLLIFARLIK